ncbi:MAG: glycosyl transferase family 2 [uncultured bacterium]|nr:MAG: glycosyl transferase family 2 [uncultured bacterium]
MSENVNLSHKDLKFSFIAGLLIGLLSMPVIKATNSNLYESIFFTIVPFFLISTPLGTIIAFRIGQKIRIVWQIAKFGVIGVLNTVVDIGFLALIIFLTKSYLSINSTDTLFTLGAWTVTFYSLYKGLSFIVANINSYYWNKYWTFQENIKKSSSEIIQFFIVSILGFVINITTASYVFGAIKPFGELNPDQWGLIGAAVGSIAGLLWNFIGYKLWVFKK